MSVPRWFRVLNVALIVIGVALMVFAAAIGRPLISAAAAVHVAIAVMRIGRWS